MPRKPRTLNSQTLKWEDVVFKTTRPVVTPVTATPLKAETGRPPGTPATDPYWEFSWQVTADSGLKLTNLVGRDTLEAGITQEVAKLVDFTDFKIAFNDTPANTYVDFPVAAAFAHKESQLEYGQNGTSMASGTSDSRYQHGLLLTLVHDFGGTCKVKLCISVVFRGAANDFDPGGFPFSLNFYPQIGYTWWSAGTSGRRVRQFRGSVRIMVNNQTPSWETMSAVPENVANFWTDSNISKNPAEKRASIMKEGNTASTWVPDMFVHHIYDDPRPFGWGLVFDYNLMDIKEEQEYDAVYGPLDGTFYRSWREGLYHWPQSGTTKVADYKVRKVPRQGYYDNIHLHGRMLDPDPRGKHQIHAPFCGHSCVHLHWRWSNISANNAVNERGWYYRGWSTGKVVEAYSVDGNPLIPPNQKLTVAICEPGRGRESAAKILPPPGSRAKLHKLCKLIWYCTDVFDVTGAKINAGEQQVIMEHGIGWAYRYALPEESPAMNEALILFRGTPYTVGPEGISFTQANLMQHFENEIYPGFRYWSARGIVTNQVPEGTHDDVMNGPSKTMESL